MLSEDDDETKDPREDELLSKKPKELTQSDMFMVLSIHSMVGIIAPKAKAIKLMGNDMLVLIDCGA